METEVLIDRLARNLDPVARLGRPWRRACAWLAASMVYLAVLSATMTSAADLQANADRWFLAPQAASILTSLVAAGAAFATIVPGAPHRLLVWPLAAVLVWLVSLLGGTAHEWPVDAATLAAPREWLCVALIALASVIPAAAMAVMLRRGAPLTPSLTMALAVLAAAGLANVSACISHPHPSSAVVLLWHGATVIALVAAGAALGRLVLTWNRAG